MLSELAASGVGAAQVKAPTGTVVASMVVSLATALLLESDAIAGNVRATFKRRRLRPRIRPLHIASPRTWLTGYVRSRFARLPHRRFTRQSWLCLITTALALVLAVGADLGARDFESRALAQWLWIASVALLLLGASLWRVKPPTEDDVWRVSSVESAAVPESATRLVRLWPRGGDLLLLAVLIVGALALRLPNLTTLPYVVHGDEASNGEQALRWLNGDVPSLLSVGWYGLPMAGYGLPALVMRVTGADLYGLRLSSVLIGVLAIALLYGFAREVAGRRVAFVAAALLAVANPFIHWSRMGIHYIHAPAVILFTVWMLVRALRRNSAVAAVAVGVGLSLSAQVYFSARIMVAIVPLFLVGLIALNRRALSGRAPVFGWLALGAAVACGPLLVYFMTDNSALVGRAQEVLIFNGTPYMQGHLKDLFGTNDLAAIVKRQLGAVPLLLSGLADQSEQYGPHYAMEDPLVASLMLVGFWLAFVRLRRPLYLLLMLWVLGTVILGDVVTIDMPWWPRLLAMLPALCLLAALALERLLHVLEAALSAFLTWLASWGREWQGWRLSLRYLLLATQMLGLIATADVVAYSLSESIEHYYVAYPAQVNDDSYRTRYTDVAYLAAQLPPGTHVVLFTDGDMIWDYATIRFLAPNVQGELARDTTELSEALAARDGPVLVIIPAEMANTFQEALATPGTIPPGDYQPWSNAFGHTTMYTYSVGWP